MFPFEVDTTTDVPLWVQLRQRLIHLINSGYFKPGDQLPTVRGLASEISINYNTVNKAYLSLVSDGYLESRADAACSCGASMPTWATSTPRRSTPSWAIAWRRAATWA